MVARGRLLATLLLVAAPFGARSWGAWHTPHTAVTVRVEDDVPVGGRLSLAYTEPHLAADPHDPDHLVVASIVGFTRAPSHGTWTCAIMLSRDGGSSWSERRLELERCADPWLALDGENAWFASLHDLKQGGHGLAVYRSRDGGGSWDPNPLVAQRGHDHPTLVRAPGGGVYVVSAYLSRGVSNVSIIPLEVPGLSSDRVNYPLPETSNTTESVVTDDGVLLVPFAGFARSVGGRQQRIDPPHVAAVMFRPKTMRITGPQPITRRCGSRKGFNTAAIDRSGGPFDQRIYLGCIDQSGGDILVVSSDDGGRSWSEPVPVLGVRNPGGNRAALRRAPDLAVGPNGTLGVVWQDRGGDAQRRCQVQRFAASTDGGVTFSKAVDLSSLPSCPDAPRNAAAARQWPAGTDYGSVVALRDGRFRAVWADARSGVYRIRMATVSVK